ncbi:hypothetical protein DSO57_1031009 [Entomophthora muscae]|uniref:Uncharacterized protein n=1 Tax=Entomophthora muscae TaxID=34485 RepID=A0ACC2TBV0_9FUNG|nr:hypothetical protein DSO57_1031009 [Entomophthora muscae]
MVSLLALLNFGSFVHSGYIVTLKSQDRAGGTTRHLEKVQKLIGCEGSSGKNRIERVFESALNGYVAQFSKQILDKVKAMSEVEAVEGDQMANATAVQQIAPWGLARLTSHGKLAGLDRFYAYDPHGGRGVDVYIVDTGIDIHHPEFQGRARWGANFVHGSPNMDETGHGTHVAGIIASKTYGVAKGASVVGVKVFDAQSQGLISQIIAGIEWAIINMQRERGNVLNLSLGSWHSEALNSAARSAKAWGFVVVVAAGNANVDACTISPASEISVLTVGATNLFDSKAGFSNWGRCLDVFAPGENILSTWNNGGTRYFSGTSMAAPHVSGMAAILIPWANTNSHDYIANLILSSAKKNVISNLFNSPNLLVSLASI